MKRIIVLLAIILLIPLTYFYHSLKGKSKVILVDNETSSNLTITVVYDNNEYDERLKTAWGFSCLLKLKGKSILFDTGGDSPTLLENMKVLGITPREIDMIFLSHIHGDHVGGLFGVLDINPNVTVYLLRSFPDSFKDRIKSYGANVVCISNPARIWDGVYSTGGLETLIEEQSLIIRTGKGLVIITGCAHPGIVNTVKRAKELTRENVYLVLGGFHLLAMNEHDIKSIIKNFKKLGVEKVAPCHCIGEKAARMFKEEYRDNFIKAGVGKIIDVA